MINRLTLLLLLSVLISTGQENDSNLFSITPELLIGITGESNTSFPDRGLQKQAIISLGWHHTKHTKAWASYLKIPKTGVSIGYTNLGNKTELGEIFTIQPFLEFNAFKSKNISVHLGTGISYFTIKHHPITNEFNKAVSTDFTWSFRLFMYYNMIQSKQINWRIGTGYAHNSNGHTKLPNQGYNSFLFSLGAEINTSKKSFKNSTPVKAPERTISNYISIRTGYGLNVLSEAFDDKESVYTISGEYGKIYNNILKLGVGAYFRFYEAYYNYISNNESLVQNGREFSDLKSNAFANALNVGITANGELLLNHFGIDLQFGINLYKPAYKIDWRINQGWGYVPRTIPESGGNFRLGDLEESYFKIKRTISARLGLKYYLIGTAKKTTNNLYIGAFINSNLGQADFTELAMGYVKVFKFRNR
ncbi:acyloxyacyl hydrolase [Flavivirga amylovorans]|uniref:Acyloxyacyl hydrolase n=1 Tax=Flavivirga amylovorans TaxID=870486 RepID=A0ABT8WYW7_9FLAO|nr:acyloxyacyl hydrolase [Flavivirga amylovorans]MDO5986663.1 acyloxyacyl hydrolase [Flavivirga amylovorans]